MKTLKLFCLLCLFTAAAGAADLPGGSLYQLHGQWRDQNNVRRDFSRLAGRPRLIAMVYTGCSSACPLLVQNIKTLKTNLPVELFSLDAENETAASLTGFLHKYKIADGRWNAYASGADDVAELAAALGVQYKKSGVGFIHSSAIFLLNAQGEIIARHTGLGTPDAVFLHALEHLN